MSVKIGFVILAHQNIDHVRRLGRYLMTQGCSVHVHVDKNSRLENELRDEAFQATSQFRSEWGKFGLVEATIETTKQLLISDPDISHVFLISEQCLPIRPIDELKDYLFENRDFDFITSKRMDSDDWIGDGLTFERVSLYHPFSFRTHRRLFELSVRLQRLFKVKRSLPDRLQASAGDQWWCLRRSTLEKMFAHPSFEKLVDFMKTSWIPDEMFFHTIYDALPDCHAKPSLTLVEFDRLGKPYTFYDDHLELLKTAPGFVARKISPHAKNLYDYFLSENRFDAQSQNIRLRDLANMSVSHVTNMGLGHDIRSRSFRLSDRQFTVFVGFGAADKNFSDRLCSGFDVSHYSNFFERGLKSSQMQVAPGNITLGSKQFVHNPHALMANLLASDSHTDVTFCLEPGQHHGLWTTLLRSPTAKIIFLEENWRARAQGNPTSTRLKRLQAVYDKLLDSEAMKQLRAEFIKVGWSEFEEDPNLPFTVAGLKSATKHG